MARLDDRRAKGAEWRKQVPFAAQAEWKPSANRADPVETLIEQGKSRIPDLLPVRYARMKADPSAFLRGAAAVMAGDLASGPSTGLRCKPAATATSVILAAMRARKGSRSSM